MPETPPDPKMPPAPEGNTELSDEELGRVSGGIGLPTGAILNEPKLPVAKHLLVPKLDSTLP